MASSTAITTVVEAASLSQLTAIAASPPAHPNTPLPATPAVPLVLYFARVPGSRDVFLTPIKPRDKVVTAEDVQSSLYYVHINCIDDHHFLQQVDRPGLSAGVGDDAEVGEIANSSNEQASASPRPPLPARRPATGLPTEDIAPALPRRHAPRSPSPKSKVHTIPRKPALADISNSQHPIPSPQHPDLPSLPRKRRPLPTSPAEADPSLAESLRASNLHLLNNSDHSPANNPYYQDYQPRVAAEKAFNAASAARVAASSAAIAAHELGSLTLIRRDPTSSQQWNVATIHDPPVHEVSSSSSTLLLRPEDGRGGGGGIGGVARKIKKAGAPVYLDITNPGYDQFVDPDHYAASLSSSATSTADSDESQVQPESTFRRRLYMPGSRFADHDYGSPRRQRCHLGSTDSTDSLQPPPTERRHHRTLSDISSAPSAVDKRSKSYAFTSPWHGACEFSTGPTGRSLKCRHTLLRPPHQQQGGSRTSTTTMVEDVSELRFNLPSSSSGATRTPQGDGGDNNSKKRASYFAPAARRAGHDSWDGGSTVDDYGGQGSSPGLVALDEHGRLDLSLGRERAGGGMGGKQAKLGKLIIEPEGVKMLDLLVAANVGLWWRAWERV